ncbi:hypothetical protein [Bradyrhizobium commune]|uniref:Uncharacterized protein n=1 Tax=Bradyrhizobium commune TaxID=83627 RepID=A0A7S9DAJ2_9BRAD|nr:hypothetical protein [Bradyrhizobium commune]QPF93439.1 hypothetical protein IC761_09290 [Bradyrhizobium commune]
MMPHRGQRAGWARLTQIDPIRVWIDAERRLMDLGLRPAHQRATKKSCGIVVPQLSRFNDA